MTVSFKKLKCLCEKDKPYKCLLCRNKEMAEAEALRIAQLFNISIDEARRVR